MARTSAGRWRTSSAASAPTSTTSRRSAGEEAAMAMNTRKSARTAGTKATAEKAERKKAGAAASPKAAAKPAAATNAKGKAAAAPARKGKSQHDGTIFGWRRENGRVGVRNHVIILPLDDLSNAACEAVANNVKGTLALPHAYGRLQFGADLDLHFRTLIGTGSN